MRNGELVPVNQDDEFPVALGQRGDRRSYFSRAVGVSGGIRWVGVFAVLGKDHRAETLGELGLSRAVAPVLTECVSCHTERPHARLVVAARDGGAAFPGDDHDVPQDIGGILRNQRAPGEVREQIRTVGSQNFRGPGIDGGGAFPTHRSWPEHVLVPAKPMPESWRSAGSLDIKTGETASLNEIWSRSSGVSLVHSSP